MIRVTTGLLSAALAAAAAGQQTSVVNSPHNLSAGGPGPARATLEDQVCIFCHTPHNASPVRPLWNRDMPLESYSIYTSRALDATPGQPTGMSKMCLSCHDGTVALGAVVSRGTPIPMSGGITTLTGASNLGTDLRDDHPISFRFDSGLAGRDPKLRLPSSLPHQVRLDANSELQCTSCHDAHNNAMGKFLVMQNSNSDLCISCHQMGQTTIVGHGQCADCHQPHTAPSGPYLLRKETVTDTCLRCHNGLTPGAHNIEPEMNRIYVHDTRSGVDPEGPPSTHATCTDCHEAHTMSTGPMPAGGISPTFGRVSGVNSSGSPVVTASQEFEVCFKCHADTSEIQPAVPRRITQNNTRLEFNTSSVSYHPVMGPGRNSDVPSLRPGWTTASVIACSDCHGTEMPAGSVERPGVHGSNAGPLLRARYDTADFTTESASAYALCYTCHDRGSILSNRSFPAHSLHIVDQRTPCSACHDSHGIPSGQGNPTNNSNLINFATNIVFPDPVTGRLEFRDTGLNTGECFLSCHGVAHSPAQYPDTNLMPTLPGAQPLRSPRR